MKQKLNILFFLLVLFLSSNLAQAGTFLMMAELDDCPYCAKWDSEVGSIYPKSAEGKLAQLKRFDLLDKPEGVEFKSRVRFSPTFILVIDNKEIGRIEGYRNAEQFWSVLSILFKQANLSVGE